MEPYFIALGLAVSKWILKGWAGSDFAEEIGDSLLDLLPSKITDMLMRRRTARQLDDVADGVASRVKNLLNDELRTVQANEVEAAVLAVERTLNLSRVSGATLIKADLELTRLEQIARAADPAAASRAGLSDAGTAVYDAVLSESIKYIVSTAMRLPEFQSAETAELLARATALSELVSQVLNSLPRSSVPAQWGLGSEASAFENKYRTSIFNYADRIRLFGVSSQYGTSTYSLSVAYISLSIEDNIFAEMDALEIEELTESIEPGKLLAPEPADGLIRVEQALARGNRLLVAGGAGSGKTTLLQWVACRAAQGAFEDTLENWNGGVPFLIPLRRYVGSALPTPEQFLDSTSNTLAGAMPTGWVHGVLADGRGIVLVDGMDELPENQRVDVKTWLEALIRDFPDNKFILTSRSTAVDEVWADLPLFSRVSLVPMELPDIVAFIDHWHDAAEASPTNDQSIEVIAKARQNILRAVRNKPAIRALCTSPLLCALICALNRERESQIPENRMDLYAVALEMLVKRRDDERKILASPNVSMTFREAGLLLRGFAVWMHENGRADATYAEYRERVARLLPSLHNVKGNPAEVANYLLVRSGVLREPVSGRVDFVHRTFLEYLAAAEIVEDGSIEKLVLNAHEDHWREVVIMGAGHASREAREKLLGGLIGRGDKELGFRHKLYLLAVACMETSTSLSPGMQLRLEACLASVMPPKNMTDAAAIASAGPLAVPLLADYAGSLATTAAACIRALVLVGGPEALDALSRFAGDSRVTVARQLIRAWPSFEPEEFVSKVLSKSPLDYGELSIGDPELLQYLRDLTHLNAAHLYLDFRLDDLSRIPSIPSVATLHASHMVKMTDLSSLNSPASLTNLRVLWLDYARSLVSLEGIEELPALKHLDLDHCQSLSELGPIALSKSIRSLSISNTAVETLGQLEGLGLDGLSALDCKNLRSLGKTISAESFGVSIGPELVDLTGIARSERLRELDVSSDLDDEMRLDLPEQLIRLTVRYAHAGVALSGGSALETCRLADTPLTEDAAEYLASLESLGELSLTHLRVAPNISALKTVARSTSLRAIDFYSFGQVVPWPELKGFELRVARSRARYVRS